MDELDRFERRFAAAYQRYLDEAPTGVDAAALARAVAARGRGRAIGPAWPTVPVGRLAWLLLLAALLTMLVAGTLLSGILRTERSSSWERLAVPGGGELTDIAEGPGGYVAIGRDGFFSSTDGREWVEAAADGAPGERLVSVTAGGPGYVAVGRFGAVWTSVDGRSWARSGSIDAGSGGWLDVRDVASRDGRLVAVGGLVHAIWTSTDASTWTPVVSSEGTGQSSYPWASGMRAVAATPTGFVAVGANDGGSIPIWTSADGLVWSQARGVRSAAGATSGFGTTARSDLRWILVDGAEVTVIGFVAGTLGASTSQDGLAWTWAPASGIAVDEFQPLSFAVTHSGFIAVATEGADTLASPGIGDADQAQRARVWSSADGIAWLAQTAPVARSSTLDTAMACGDDVLVSGVHREATTGALGWVEVPSVWRLAGAAFPTAP